MAVSLNAWSSSITASSLCLALVAFSPSGADAAGRSVTYRLTPPSAVHVNAIGTARPFASVSSVGRTSGLGRSAAVGWEKVPFTLALVDVPANSSGGSPYRPIGQLVADLGNGQFGRCTATLIRPSIVLTSAHCLAPYGKSPYKSITFTPGYDGTAVPAAPYGTFKGAFTVLPQPWTAATDVCNGACLNDIGLVILDRLNSKRAGDVAGTIPTVTTESWGAASALVTAVGYPQGIEGGKRAIRVDSTATLSSGLLRYGGTWGPGADGAPVVMNFGKKAAATDPVFNGGSNSSTYVIGVSSQFGTAIIDGKTQSRGLVVASSLGFNVKYPAVGSLSVVDMQKYGTGNIGALLKHACTNYILSNVC